MPRLCSASPPGQRIISVCGTAATTATGPVAATAAGAALLLSLASLAHILPPVLMLVLHSDTHSSVRPKHVPTTRFCAKSTSACKVPTRQAHRQILQAVVILVLPSLLPTLTAAHCSARSGAAAGRRRCCIGSLLLKGCVCHCQGQVELLQRILQGKCAAPLAGALVELQAGGQTGGCGRAGEDNTRGIGDVDSCGHKEKASLLQLLGVQ